MTQRGTDILERIQRRTTAVNKGLELLSYEKAGSSGRISPGCVNTRREDTENRARLFSVMPSHRTIGGSI